MVGLEKLQELSAAGQDRLDSILLPVDSIIREMPEVILADSVSHYLENGQAVIVPHAPTEGMLRIYNENRDFLGVGEVLDDGRVAPRRLVNLSPD
jgi:tRNA pseudouridine55 synthase